MDDSDQDFVDLCSRLLKRVRKKPGESRQPRKAEQQPASQSSDRDKRKRNNKQDGDSRAKCAGTRPAGAGAGAEQPVVVCSGTAGLGSGDAGSSGASAAAGPGVEPAATAKDKVLQRMQRFKRAGPQKMVLKDKNQTTGSENHCGPPLPPSPPPPPLLVTDPPESLPSGLHPEIHDCDEALALRLQQELDMEVKAQRVDLEDGGLFFCQICQKDLSHMTPEGRTQHLNRCLDESEESGPPPPPPSGVPDCPICGKKFKSQKSRSTHLKRCSSEMDVPPAVLLQALQRQAEETQSVPATNTITENVGVKRKVPSKSGLPARKKPRKKTEPLDEDTMVALALSSSLLQQEQEAAASLVSTAPVPTMRPEAGKGRGKRKKAAVHRPPPLLLVQDAEAALARLQDRVSALLLRGPPPSPPTPTRSPSSLSSWSGAAPLWQKSALLDGGSTCVSDFYTPELREFITPWELAVTDAAVSSGPTDKSEPSTRPASAGTPVGGTRASVLPSSRQKTTADAAAAAAASPAPPSTPGTGQLSVGSQTLRDLMDLAEDGMTLTQCGDSASDPDKESAVQTAVLRMSGFVPEEAEEQSDHCVSGFLPETTDRTLSRLGGAADRPGADGERGSHRSVALSTLASDLSSMVNNPQLSDVQLQVDSGEVYFAHSFMVYARCPLLAEMVHESGFGVREEGMPAAQRVLMSDIPGRAVFALLQYLYTARCSVPAALLPDVLELASRFDLQELQQICELSRDDPTSPGDEEEFVNQEESVGNQTDQAFAELLRSMWTEEEEHDGAKGTDRGSDEERGSEEDRQVDDLAAGEREIREEKVNEEELEEIYEFAATQRKREEGEKDSMEEEEEEEEQLDDEEDGEEVFTKLAEPKGSSTGLRGKDLQPDNNLDRSYSRLFSESWGVYEEGDPSSLPGSSSQERTHTPQSQKHQSPRKKSSSKLSSQTLLQSSVSEVDELSLSPPPCTSNLPVPGQSPGLVDLGGTGSADLDKPSEEGLPLSDPVPLSPESPQKKKEPELIVLSDSSEEMEVVLSSRSPSLPSPNPPGYTRIRPNESAREDVKSGTAEFSPAAPDQSRPGSVRDPSRVDYSPEVSWLVPSTPVQHRRSTSSSSTQTKSSMCRTRLFPKGDASSSSGASARDAPMEDAVQRLKQEETDPCSPGLDFSFRPGGTGDREVFAVPLSRRKPPHPLSSTSTGYDTPLHPLPQPHSSTPLLTPVPLATSPLLHGSLDKRRSTSQERDGAPPDNPERTDSGSFHLPSLSDPSDSPSSSSRRGRQGSQRRSDGSGQSGRSVESSDNEAGDSMRIGIRDDDEAERESENKNTAEEGEREEATGETGGAEASRCSFEQSFMAADEPPIAFDDSWGLGVCVDANPGCFSLRLEDSGGSSQRERSPAKPSSSSSSSSSFTNRQPSPSSLSVRLLNRHASVSASPSWPSTGAKPVTPSPPDPTGRTTPENINSLLDSKIWDSWEDREEEVLLPLSQRVNPSAQHKTPAPSRNKRRRTLVPITPMPHYSDMDTPELKNKLSRFGVRPLPKRQMILKLREIHQYTHQLVSSDSEEEPAAAHPGGRTAQTKPPPRSSKAAAGGPLSCAQAAVRFKEPQLPAATSPLKLTRRDEEPLSASQGSNTSSTAASEESERSNPELCLSSDGDSDSDGGISASQAANRLQDRLQAVRSFILSDPELYTQILQYRPLVLSQLQQRLKAAGIRLGAAKLVDYLDSQCITFTTAKPGQQAPGRRRGKRTGKGAARENGVSRRKGVAAVLQNL